MAPTFVLRTREERRHHLIIRPSSPSSPNILTEQEISDAGTKRGRLALPEVPGIAGNPVSFVQVRHPGGGLVSALEHPTYGTFFLAATCSKTWSRMRCLSKLQLIEVPAALWRWGPATSDPGSLPSEAGDFLTLQFLVRTVVVPRPCRPCAHRCLANWRARCKALVAAGSPGLCCRADSKAAIAAW